LLFPNLPRNTVAKRANFEIITYHAIVSHNLKLYHPISSNVLNFSAASVVPFHKKKGRKAKEKTSCRFRSFQKETRKKKVFNNASKCVKDYNPKGLSIKL